MRQRTFIAAIVLGALASFSGAFGQASQTSAPDTAAQPKKARVWTNDNIDAVRSPSDDYVIEKQQTEAQQDAVKQAAAQKAADDAKAAVASTPTPKTLQEADQMIAQKQAQLTSEQNYIEQTKQELATAPDSQKARLQWRIQSRSDGVSKMQAQLSELQKQKDALAAKQKAQGAAGSDATASANAQQ